MRIQRSRSLLVILIALSAWAASAQENAAPRIFVDRVDVSVVNVEAFVTDRDGNRVFGLTANDFEIRVDGEPVEITNFFAFSREEALRRDLEAHRAMVEAVERGEPLPARPARRVPEEQRLQLVVYVDHYNIHPANRKRVLDQLEAFLEDRMVRGDFVMLVGYHRRLTVEQSFTRDEEAVRSALGRLHRSSAHRPVDDGERRRLMRTMATSNHTQEALGHLQGYVRSLQDDLRQSAIALGGVVTSLAGLPGRKALLYVSDGIPKRPGEELYQYLLELQQTGLLGGPISVDPIMETFREDETRLFNDIVRNANAHQVTFYTLDARGSRAESTISAEHASQAVTEGGRLTSDMLRTLNLQEPLIDMAAATGGRAILNTFDFEGAFHRVADDFDNFYSLGFRSDGDADARFRSIEVRVRRPGLQVRHRTGYVHKPAVELVADRTLSSLILDLQSNPLDVRLDFGQPQRERRQAFHLPVEVRIPLRGVTLLTSGGMAEGRLRFFIGVKDEEGRFSTLHERELPLRIPQDQLEEAQAQEVTFAVQLQVRPGRPTVAVGVWDELSGEESFVLKQVVVRRR